MLDRVREASLSITIRSFSPLPVTWTRFAWPSSQSLRLSEAISWARSPVAKSVWTTARFRRMHRRSRRAFGDTGSGKASPS